MIKTTLPPGNYWVGDTSFAFPYPLTGEPNRWDPWNDALLETGFFAVKNHYGTDQIELCAFPTRFSCYPAIYHSKSGDEFPTESATLGVISKSSLEFLESDIEFLKEKGIFITFHEPFDVFEENDIVHIGPIEIDTKSFDYDQNYDEDEEDE